MAPSMKRKATEDLGRTTQKPKTEPNNSREPHIIAYSHTIQEQFISQNICYGVQYELARLISMGRLSYLDVTAACLSHLTGKNQTSAAKTGQVLTQAGPAFFTHQDHVFAQEHAARSPWEQLDTEEDLLSKNPLSGLGHSVENPNWYGGKIEFHGRIQQDEKSYTVSLDRCTLGSSCRFTRRFGSKAFLRIKIPLQILHTPHNELEVYFKKPFILWGSVFRSFYAKDDSVFLFRTNEIMEDGVVTSKGSPGFSLSDFLEWHNPLAFNSKQVMTKWAARFALGLSNSFPGPIILQENIGHEDDIISASSSDMTDGCGSANHTTHLQVYHMLGCDPFPTAFQFRLAGNKGMCLERKDTGSDDSAKIWLRPSQTKIHYQPNTPLDPANLIIELLRTSRMKSPARVSPETIINLAENGVPHHVFGNLLKKSLSEVIEGLTTWEGPDAMYKLWVNVERAGGVFFARRVREAAGEARVRGLGHGHSEAVDNEDEDDDEDGIRHFDRALDERSTAWWADQISGCPSSLEETVMTLLDSGFTPQECPILREKLKQVVTIRIRSRSEKYRYDVDHSASAFVVPDPYGVLGPDEIHVKSSRRDLKTAEGLLTDIVVGSVLLTRNPCKLPTDVRKVTAVEHIALRDYVDVIVCSVQGHRRLLDYLAGGDYDGDTAIVIWAQEMVESFENANEKYSEEPSKLVKDCFLRNDEGVDDFMKRTATLSREETATELQVYLLGALRDTSVIGKYSAMHDNSVYSRGYANPRTIKLAYKFCQVLDGAKTGLKIKPGTLKDDLKLYYHPRGPEWKAVKTNSSKKSGTGIFDIDKSNSSFLERRQGDFVRGPFIMDVLKAVSKAECDKYLIAVDAMFSPLAPGLDPHLAKPWNDAVGMAERGSPEAVKQKRKDLATIALHVQAMYGEHKTNFRGKGPGKGGNGRSGSFTHLAIEVRQDILRALSKKFAASPKLEDLDSIMDEAMVSRLRASYAYIYDHEQLSASQTTWSRFPWNVAMRELCSIKAESLGPYKTITNGFYERFKLSMPRQ